MIESIKRFWKHSLQTAVHTHELARFARHVKDIRKSRRMAKALLHVPQTRGQRVTVCNGLIDSLITRRNLAKGNRVARTNQDRAKNDLPGDAHVCKYIGHCGSEPPNEYDREREKSKFCFIGCGIFPINEDGQDTPASGCAMQNSYIARQPIFTHTCDVFGYELLFRAGPENFFSSTDRDIASARVVADAMHLHELDTLSGGGRCFINVTEKIMLDELYLMLPQDRVVLELLETIDPTPDLLAACTKCRDAGYTIALDDYALQAKFAPLLPLIDILKVDFSLTTSEQQAALAQQTRNQRFELLAEKIETHAEFHAARKLGYRYFQGFFFCKPEMISRKDVSPSNLAYMQLLQQIAKPRLDHAKLDETISRDLGLSYKLLRYLNSAAFSFRYEITSIRRAIILLGDEPLRKWGSLLVLGILGESKPTELLCASMIRAKLCEHLLLVAGHTKSAQAGFMVGMFSMLPAMLDQPLEVVLDSICLPDLVDKTLRGESTAISSAMELVYALECAEWDRVTQHSTKLGLTEHQIAEAYMLCMKWVTEQMPVVTAKPQSQSRSQSKSKRSAA